MTKKSKNILIIILSIGFCILLFTANLLINLPTHKNSKANFEKFQYRKGLNEQNENKDKFPVDLEIFPSNYLDVIDKNKLNIEQKNRVKLLRYGKTVVNQNKSGNYLNVLNSLLNTETPVLINNQILSIYFKTELIDIKKELMEEEFKKELIKDFLLTNAKISIIKTINLTNRANLNILQQSINSCVNDLNNKRNEKCFSTLNSLDSEEKKLFQNMSSGSSEKIQYMNSLLDINSDKIFEKILSDNDLGVLEKIESKANNAKNRDWKNRIEIEVDNALLDRMIDLSKYLVENLHSLDIRNKKLELLEKNLLTVKDIMQNKRADRGVLKEILLSQQYNLDNTQVLLTTIREEGRNILFATPYISNTPMFPLINNDNFSEDYDIAPLPIVNGAIRLPIMMYHYISNPIPNDPYKLYVTPEIFEKQIAYLVRKNYKILNVEEFNNLLASGVNPKQKSVLLTFDDATPTHYSVAYPILKKYGQTGVFFMIASRSLLNHAQIKEMSDGGMYIQSHSNTHAYFGKISNAKVNEEMATSKSIIEGITGKPVTLIAYPGCNADYRSFDIARDNGYSAAFSCGPYIDIKLDRKYYISRVHPYNDMESFIKMLSVGL